MCDWLFRHEGWDPKREKTDETLFVQSNGYLGVRAYAEEGVPGREGVPGDFHDDPNHMPHQYAACVFDASPVTGNTLVNLPTLRLISLHLDGEKLDLSMGRTESFERVLDLESAVGSRSMIWTSPQGKTTRIRFTSFLSQERIHVLATRLELTPENWSGPVTVDLIVDGTAGTQRHHHLDALGASEVENGLQAGYRTKTSGIEVQILRTLVCEGDWAWQDVESTGLSSRRRVSGGLGQGASTCMDLLAVLTASNDLNASEAPLDRANQVLAAALERGFDALREEQKAAWQAMWGHTDVRVDCEDSTVQLRLRFYLFQLLQAYRAGDPRLSIGAKMLTGQHYSGHYFWDTEIFMLPFYLYTQPDAARDLLQCRIDSLDSAREKARAMGFRGAFFPWEADPIGGGENCPKLWEDEKSGIPVRILCGEIELHINSAIVYGLEHYYRVTGDEDFWFTQAAPVVLESARFWVSRGEWDGERFVIRNVIGPDEYHEEVDNDAYTNFTARWNIGLAFELLDEAPPGLAEALRSELALTDAELQEWKRVQEGIVIGEDPERGILAQDDTYLSLPVTPLDSLDLSKPQYHFYKPGELTKMSMVKQASVIALHHLFPFAFDREQIARNWDFYEPRTLHDSNLSAGSHAYVASLLNRTGQAEQFYAMVLATDLDDDQGNAEEGIHAANAGSAWFVAVTAFGGIAATRRALHCDPDLPAGWKSLSFPLVFRGRRLRFTLTGERIQLAAASGAEIDVVLKGKGVHLDSQAQEIEVPA